MKKLLALLLLTISFTASAQHFHHHHNWHHRYYYGGSNGGWVAPLIIGGVVGAAIATRPTIQTQTETVIVQQPITEQTCTAWKEIQANDGTIYRERTCTNTQK